MKQPFLITGLPRSRTAWLTAAANTVPGALCTHEESIEWDTWDQAFDVWGSATHRYRGFSDSLLGLHLRPIMERARPRCLVVVREVDAVADSLRRLLPGYPDPRRFLELLARRLEDAIDEFGLPTIKFRDLGDSAKVALALRGLMPGAAVDHGRVASLTHLNVQVDVRHTFNRIEARRDSIATLLGADVVSAL